MAENGEGNSSGQDVLDQYIVTLVDRTYGSAMDDDAKHEAVIDLKGAFQKLYGARLLEKLSDEQQEEAERLVNAGEAEKVVDLAVKSGINMPQFMTELVTEFEELYAPAAEE